MHYQGLIRACPCRVRLSGLRCAASHPSRISNINENDYNKLLHFSFTKIIYELKSLNIIKFGIQFFDSFFNTINFNQYHFYLDLEFELSEH